jgi:NitT/TauT family transport system substrate-binding protein
MPDAPLSLRMNQGDPTESRIYYLPHYVAADLGLFEAAGVQVDFVWSPRADGLAHSGQVPAVERGEADLTIGGPMVTMRKLVDEGVRIVNFCAAVRANPWYLLGRRQEPDFRLTQLVGKTVVDVANITTATLCFRWLLARAGIADRVTVTPGSGDESHDLAVFGSGQGDYLLHSLHGAGPAIASGDLVPVQDLATPTGPVPWSAYIALPATLQARRREFLAFTRAIGEALAWVQTHDAADIARLVSGRYTSYPLVALMDSIARYKAVALWPDNTLIPRADFEHFCSILVESGWLGKPVRYEDQVDVEFATLAAAAADGGRRT